MRNVGFKLLYLFLAIVVVVNTFFSIKSNLFTDISKLPEGTLETSLTQNTLEGQKTLNIYIVKNNLGVAIRGEIEHNNKRHNIFWQTGIDGVEAAWLDADTVLINDIPLNADDTFGYDCRRGYSLFDEGSLEQNFTSYNN